MTYLCISKYTVYVYVLNERVHRKNPALFLLYTNIIFCSWVDRVKYNVLKVGQRKT